MLKNIIALIAIVFLIVANAAISSADERIAFDVANSLEVRDVTTQDFAARYPHEKLILITANVSLFVSPDAHAELNDVLITLDSSSAEFQVVDFLPKTTLDSRVSGNVNVQMKDSSRSSLDFDASGYYKSLTGAYLTGSFQNEHKLNAQFQMLPPRELVMASGTVQRGKGVYFKLRASSQNTIEGEKVFLIVARVPRYWRGDVARIRCEAHGKSDFPFGAFEGTTTHTSQDFLVALYQSGDELARTQAERFITAEERLRTIAHSKQKSIERDSTPKLLRKVGISSPSIPANWLHHWIFGPARNEIASQLPSPVRETALQYTQARADLHRLNGE